MVRLFGWKETLPERDSFSDVTADRWFYRYVETAKAHGAIAVSDHAFRPTDDITREDMAAMLVRGLGYTSLAGEYPCHLCKKERHDSGLRSLKRPPDSVF